MRTLTQDELRALRRFEKMGSTPATRCGCFYCFAKFALVQIEEWVDDTPLCPECGVDAIIMWGPTPIANVKAITVDQDVLHQMHAFWF